MGSIVHDTEYRQEECCNIEGVALLFGVQTFGEYLEAAIYAAKLDKSSFAERIGVSKQHVTEMTKDRRSPNLKDVEAWADVLGLRGEDRELFRDLAVMRHIPSAARSRYLTFVDLVDQVRRERARRVDAPARREE